MQVDAKRNGEKSPIFKCSSILNTEHFNAFKMLQINRSRRYNLSTYTSTPMAFEPSTLTLIKTLNKQQETFISETKQLC